MRTIGVDLGGTKCYGLLLEGDGSIVAEHRVPTPRGREAVIEAVASVVDRLRQEGGDDVTSVGVGVPGLVDRAGVLRFAPNLPGTVDVDMQACMTERLPGLRWRFENDATCAGWGEKAHGAAQGMRDVVVVTLGTGIGGGIITGGEIFLGSNGFAGEIGHMVVDPHGPPCPCGKKGCWERFASGSGLGRLAREEAIAGRAPRVIELAGGDPELVKGEHVTAAAAEGDDGARRILTEFAWWLALGLANLANVFDPECFVIGGGLIAAGDLLMGPAREAFDHLVEGSQHRPEVAILPAQLGERAGAIGAGALAR